MNVPSLPRQRLGLDIALFVGVDYLITTDYHSNFQFDLLPDLHALTVIKKLKGQFA